MGHFWQNKFSSVYYKGNNAFYKENQHKIWDFSKKVGLTEPNGEKPTGNDWLSRKKVTNKFSAQNKQYKGHFGQNKFFRVYYKGNKAFYQENPKKIWAVSRKVGWRGPNAGKLWGNG